LNEHQDRKFATRSNPGNTPVRPPAPSHRAGTAPLSNVRRYSDLKLGAEFDLAPALTPASSDSVASGCS
jgi:hypothetical protein